VSVNEIFEASFEGIPLMSTPTCKQHQCYSWEIIKSPTKRLERRGGLWVDFHFFGEKSIRLSINLLMTAWGLIEHLWYQTQTEVSVNYNESSCERDLVGGGRVSVYTVMLIDLAFPLFKQVGKTQSSINQLW